MKEINFMIEITPEAYGEQERRNNRTEIIGQSASDARAQITDES
jgi:hypothetical protein